MKKIFAVLLVVLLCVSLVHAEQQAPAYSIQINIASRTLRLYSDGVLQKEYPVAVGKPATKTPIGNFSIRNKVVNPYWNNNGNVVAPGPKNPLGIRWLGISAPGGTYGIHGNSVPASISTFASGGCIRMFNNDVEELYSIVAVKTPVQIVYENIEFQQDAYTGSTVLIVYPDVYKKKNAKAVLEKLLEKNVSISEEQKEKALKLAVSKISSPVALSDGTAVLLNNKFITNDAFIEEGQIYMSISAGMDCLGIDDTILESKKISIKDNNEKAYINLTEAAAKLGGQLKIDKANNNVNLSLSLVRLNGKYLCSYNGGFDKQYQLKPDVLNTALKYSLSSSKADINLKDFCKQHSWQLNSTSIQKILDIYIPLRIKIGDVYINTTSYNGRYYIDSAEAVALADVQNQKLNIYPYKDKNYYDVFEIMEVYEWLQDDFNTTVEVFKPISSEI